MKFMVLLVLFYAKHCRECVDIHGEPAEVTNEEAGQRRRRFDFSGMRLFRSI